MKPHKPYKKPIARLRLAYAVARAERDSEGVRTYTAALWRRYNPRKGPYIQGEAR